MKVYMYNGQPCRVLWEEGNSAWIITQTVPLKKPFQVSAGDLTVSEEPEPPTRHWTKSQEARKNIRYRTLGPLIVSRDAIVSNIARNEIVKRICESTKLSPRTILRLYYAYLAYGESGLYPGVKQQQKKSEEYTNFRKAIKKYYYSSRKLSLQKTYEFMLVDFYTDDGKLKDRYPSFAKFRSFFYRQVHNPTSAIISKEGYTYYQRNARPLFGKAADSVDSIGVYEMDATEADVFLVSRHDRTQTIGRPIIYIAVDRATQLIAGFYIGLTGGAEAVMECLRNAASDKRAFCREYEIEIQPEQWPASGLPSTLVTDRGREFMGDRVDELCRYCGITLDTLPPYRPELKGTVEKMFDLLQQHIKPLLFHQGAIEQNFAERGAPDYRLEAALTLKEYTKLFIHAVIYCNSLRVQANYTRSADMIADGVVPTAAKLWAWYESKDASRIIPLSTAEHILLPRGTAHFSRRGLEFKSLKYRNKEFDKRSAKAGMSGKEEVTVAYLPNDPRVIWLVDGGNYYEFHCSSINSSYEGLSFSEIQIIAGLEKKKTNEAKRDLLPKTIEQTLEMKEVVRSAAESKTGTGSIGSLADVEAARKKEGVS